MKIQCNVCEVAEAKVLCCADEAALCEACDQKVHAANKLAGKHQRLPLSTSSSHMPKCDVCQETVGYFFCLQDRSLLCRRCDVAIHTANPLVSAHQRFLLTGVKAGLEATEWGPSSSGKTHSHSNEKISGLDVPHLQSNEKSSGLDLHPVSKRITQVSTTDQSSKNMRVQSRDFSSSKLPFSGGSTGGSFSQWQLDEFLDLGDYNQSYDFTDHVSSKEDYGRFGDLDCSPILQPADMELEGDDGMGLRPDTFWAVPEIVSPPTASGLSWSKMSQVPNSTVFVPDITSLPSQNSYYESSHSDITKRRRRF